MSQNLHAQDEERNFLVDRDVAFLPEGRAEKLDLYLPPDPKPGIKRAAIVVIHGGGWRLGDKADPREVQMAATLANAGYVVASVNYQLADRDKPSWPTCIQDCREAVAFLRKNADEYAINPDRIGAIGGSAGGNLSLLLGTPDPAQKVAPVQAVVALYAPTDLIARKNETQLMFGQSRTQRPDLYKEASPYHQATASFPPTLLIHGTADTVVEPAQSELMAKKLKELGIKHELILVPDAPHTFKLKDDAHDFRDKVLTFFARHLK